MRLLMFFLLTFPMLAQQAVTWTPGMDYAYVNGRLQYRAASESAGVKVLAIDSGSVMSDARFIIAAIIVENRSGRRFDLFPNRFALSLLDAKKPPEGLEYISPERVISQLKT